MSTSSSAQLVLSSPTTLCCSVEESAATLLPHSSVVLDLAELAEKYAQLVPFRMRVVNCFMAADNSKRVKFMVDEIYSVHLVREVTVVRMKSADGEFIVPLNSAAKFGLIYDEQNEDIVFGTVEELLYAKPHPKVIAVKNKYVSPDGKVSLKKKDVLIIREVIRAKIGRSKIALKFFSVSTHKEIVLHKEHDVQFTTSPHFTQLYLTDLTKYSTNFLPCSARLFLTDDSSITGLPSSAFVALQSYETYQSVIVSLFHDRSKSDCRINSNFIDVPTSININLRIIETRKDNTAYHQIIEESKNLLQNFSQTKMCVCVDGQTDDAYVMQSTLLTEIRRDKVKENLAKLVPWHYLNFFHNEMKTEACGGDRAVSMPTSATKHQLSDPPQASAKVRTTRRFSDSAASPCDFPQPFHLQPSDIGGQIRSGDAASYRRPKTCPAIFSKVIDAGHKLKKPPQVAPNPQDFIYEELAPLPPPLTTSAVGYEQVTNFKHNRNDLDPPQQNCKQQQNGFDQALPPRNPYVKFSSKASQPDEHCAEMSINAMAAQIEEMQERLAKIVKLMDEVLKKQSHFEAELSTLSGTGGNLKKKILLVNKGMSAADVLGLLDAIGLPQYKEAFTREAIDGELFSSLDNEMLAKELDVSSKIHRLRILKLIEPEDTYMLMK